MRTSFRARLLWGFLGLAIVTSGLVILLGIQRSKDAVLEQIQSNVQTIAIAAAAEIDVSEHEAILTEADEETADYRKIQLAMREVRDRNRRDDIHVAYIYTYRPSVDKPGMFTYVVDAEEPGEDHSPVGQLIVWDEQGEPGDTPLEIGPAYVDAQFITDAYGSWLSGYAPIRSDSGKIVAMVGVDISAESVVAKWNEITKGLLLALGLAIALATLLAIILSRVVTKPLSEITEAVQEIGSGELGVRLPAERRDEFGIVARNLNDMAQSLQERDALKGALSRYVSQDAARQLIEENMLPQVSGELRDVTVLTADIANLNRLAERIQPEQIVGLLNEYFEVMVEIIFHHNGTIDRLLGNRLIAVFGAPISDEQKERNAINASLAMREELARLNAKWKLSGEEKFRLGVGIHTSPSLQSNVGSRANTEFTVLGSSVDIATLIGSKSEEFATDTLVSETTTKKVRDEFSFDEVGDVQPLGAADFIRLYAVRQLSTA